MPFYVKRIVPAHGDSASTVFLVNEAPGPCEAHYRIPSVSQQGGNIYWALRRAGINWAASFDKFAWPNIRQCYKYPDKVGRQFQLRDSFLTIRARYLTCSDAYPLWPRSSKLTYDWIDPASADVLSATNIARLKSEIPAKHRVILVCGVYAWLACHGTTIALPMDEEGKELSFTELARVNDRLASNLVRGWCMGHTRRWSLNADRTSTVLRAVGAAANWQR